MGLGLPPGQCLAESRLMLQSLAKISPDELYRAPETVLPQETLERIQAVLQARVTRRTPIQYLLGEAEFFGLTLAVTPAVLIPRPETELLVEYVQQAVEARRANRQQPLRVLDIGTGSGAIALALKHALCQQIEMHASDISPDALAIARQNAARHGVEITFYESDLCQQLPEALRFDVIVSNPPYISESEKVDMAPEVLSHEPHLALFPTEDRLVFYERLIGQIRQYLSPGGALWLEFGTGMADEVSRLLSANGFHPITVHTDYAGYSRFAGALKNS